MIESIDDVKWFFDRELDRSKSTNSSPWGRQAINALDSDNIEELVKIYKNKSIGANINEQTTTLGYAGYLWTMKIHQYLGDSILHLAIKMRKIKSVYILLLYDADIHITNANDLTCDDVAREYYGKSLKYMKSQAYHELIPAINPLRIHHIFPDNGEFESIVDEAYRLLYHGRVLNTGKELPKTFHYPDLKIKKSKLPKVTPPSKPVWRRRRDMTYDGESYLLNTLTGEKRSMTAQEVKYGYWDAVPAADGTIYYINELTCKVLNHHPDNIPVQVDMKNEIKDANVTNSSTSVTDPIATSAGIGEVSSNHRDVVEDGYHNSDNHDIAAKHIITSSSLPSTPGIANNTTSPSIQPTSNPELPRHPFAEDPVEIDLREVKLFEMWVNEDDAKEDFPTWRVKYESGTWKPSGAKQRLLDPSYDFEHFYSRQQERHDERVAQHDNEMKTGENSTYGCLGLGSGDVWNRDNVTDIIRMIRRQQARRKKIRSIVAVRDKLRDPLYYTLDMNERHAMKMPFLDDDYIDRCTMNDDMITAEQRRKLIDPDYPYIDQLRGDCIEEYADHLPARCRLTPAMITREIDKEEQRIHKHHRYQPIFMYDDDEVEDKKRMKANQPQHRYDFKRLEDDDVVICMDEAIYRPITKLSTHHNLKYMQLGNDKVDMLFTALHQDEIITHISLAKAGISMLSSTMCQAIASMSALTYVDLSQNALTDDAVLGAFIDAIGNTRTIRTLSLAANKLTIDSIMPLLEQVLKPTCAISWISVANNKLSKDDYSRMQAYIQVHPKTIDASLLPTVEEKKLVSEEVYGLSYAQALKPKDLFSPIDLGNDEILLFSDSDSDGDDVVDDKGNNIGQSKISASTTGRHRILISTKHVSL